MIAARLQVIDGFGDSGIVGTLALLEAKTTEQLDGNDSARFRVALPLPVAVSLRTVLRLTGADGVVREYRVSRMVRDPKGFSMEIEGSVPFADFAVSGFVRAITSGVQYTSFGGSLSASQWIANYVLTNLAEDELEWLDTTLGVIDSGSFITLQFQLWTRGQLLRALSDATGMELYLSQPSVGSKYRINLVAQRGVELPLVRVSRGRNLFSLQIDSADDGMATAVFPFGDVPEGGTEPATIAENAWTIQSIASGWVVLYDPSADSLPIVIDDMANGWYLEVLSGTTVVRRAITDSRASDGAVYLADTSLLNIGMVVSFVADSSGTPLTVLAHPAAVAQYGRVLMPLALAGMRGERNYMRSGSWGAYPNGWVSSMPTQLAAAINGLLIGARSALDASALAVDGFTPGDTVYRGERIEVGSSLIATTSADKVVPSTGLVTLPLSGTLAANVADGATFPTRGGVTANGAQSAGATTLAVQSTIVTRKLTAGDKVRFLWGGLYSALSQSATALTNTNATGAPVDWNVTLPLSQSMSASQYQNQQPYNAALVDGDPITLTYNTPTTGWKSIQATADGPYSASGYSINVTISVPANSTITFPAYYPITLLAEKSLTEERTITNSSTEWPDSKQLNVTWAGALTYAGEASVIQWLTGAGALLAEFVGTATYTSTSWLVANGNASVFPAGATFYSNPAVFYADASVVMNSAGAGAIPIVTPSPLALTDNAAVTIPRTPLLITPEFDSGVLLRASAGWRSGEIALPIGQLPSATFWVQAGIIWWSPDGSPLGRPVFWTMTVFDAATNAVLGTVVSDSFELGPLVNGVAPAPIQFTLKAQIELPVLTRVYVTVTKTGTPDFTTSHYQLLSHSMITRGTDPNVPITQNSHANAGVYSGARYLLDYAKEVRSITCSLAQLAEIQQSGVQYEVLAVGGSLFLADLMEELRIVGIDRDHININRTVFSVELLKRTLSRIVGTGSSIASTGSGATGQIATGTITPPSGGGGGSTGVTVIGPSGLSLGGVQTLRVAGASVSLAAEGSSGARITIGELSGLAPLVTVMIPFGALTFTAASASTEIDADLRTYFDLSNACSVRLQGRIATALAGARIACEYYDADATTWKPLDGSLGPVMVLDATGDYKGPLANPVVFGDVLLRLVCVGGNDSTNIPIGNLHLMVNYKAGAGSCAVQTPWAP